MDAGITRVRRARRYRAADGSSVDLGLVGIPTGSEAQGLLHELAGTGLIPVIASIGSDAKGRLYNVNAERSPVTWPGGSRPAGWSSLVARTVCWTHTDKRSRRWMSSNSRC